MKFDGRKLKETRLLQGLRQADVAELTRQQGQLVDSRTLSHWENCPTANPRPKNLAVVAKVLSVDPEIFYISESGGAVHETNALSGGPIQPALRFCEALGYVIAQDDANGLILQSSGRRKDVFLSCTDLERIYTHVKKYTDFLLSEYVEAQRKSPSSEKQA